MSTQATFTRRLSAKRGKSGEPPQADYSVQGAWRKIKALLLRNNSALLVSADKNKPLPMFLVSACLLTFINEVSAKVDSGEPGAWDAPPLNRREVTLCLVAAFLLRNTWVLLLSADKNKPLPIFLVSVCLLTFIIKVSTLVDSGRTGACGASSRRAGSAWRSTHD